MLYPKPKNRYARGGVYARVRLRGDSETKNKRFDKLIKS
nr:MAG TPA: hypothetical protein [Caudoviricetes sp.]